MNKFFEKISELVKLESQMMQDSFGNTTNKGSGFEVIIRNLLSRYTEGTIRMLHGEILDTFGHQTGQIDFSLVQDIHPKGYDDGRPNLIMYDYLLASGEVKMKLNTAELRTCVATANQFKDFKRHEENNNMTANIYYGSDSSQKPPPFFAVALNSDIAYDTIESTIAGSHLTLVCIIKTQHSEGLICLGDTHPSKDFTDWLSANGVAKTQKTFVMDNPLVALIFAANEFKVPALSLSNVTSNYFK